MGTCKKGLTGPFSEDASDRSGAAATAAPERPAAVTPHKDSNYLQSLLATAVGNEPVEALIDLARWCLDQYPAGHARRGECLAQGEVFILLADTIADSVKTAFHMIAIQEERGALFRERGDIEDAERTDALVRHIRTVRLPARGLRAA